MGRLTLIGNAMRLNLPINIRHIIHNQQQGFTYIGVLVIVAVMMMALGTASEIWHTVMQPALGPPKNSYMLAAQPGFQIRDRYLCPGNHGVRLIFDDALYRPCLRKKRKRTQSEYDKNPCAIHGYYPIPIARKHSNFGYNILNTV